MNCFLKFQLLYYSIGYSKYNIICTYYNVLPKISKKPVNLPPILAETQRKSRIFGNAGTLEFA